MSWTLSNGKVESESDVRMILVSLASIRGNPFAFYDAATLARDPSYQWQMLPSSRKTLADLQFLDESGSMHPTVRNVIECAVVGDDFKMEILPLDKIVKTT